MVLCFHHTSMSTLGDRDRSGCPSNTPWMLVLTTSSIGLHPTSATCHHSGPGSSYHTFESSHQTVWHRVPTLAAHYDYPVTNSQHSETPLPTPKPPPFEILIQLAKCHPGICSFSKEDKSRYFQYAARVEKYHPSLSNAFFLYSTAPGLQPHWVL